MGNMGNIVQIIILAFRCKVSERERDGGGGGGGFHGLIDYGCSNKSITLFKQTLV